MSDGGLLYFELIVIPYLYVFSFVANCATQEADKKRKLCEEYSAEYLLLLESVVEKRNEAVADNAIPNFNFCGLQPSMIEKCYMIRILDKFIIEIEDFLTDCRLASQFICKHCT